MNFLNFHYTFILLTEVPANHKNVPASLSPVIFLREVFFSQKNGERRLMIMRWSLDCDYLAWRLARRPASGVTCSKLFNLSKPHTAHREKGDE